MSTINQPTDEFAAGIAKNLKTLMRHRGITAKLAMSRLHVSNGTWYSHMNTDSWSARQMSDLADMLDVPIEVLYGDPEELVRSRCFSQAPEMTVIAGEKYEATAAARTDRSHLRLVK